MSTLTVQNLVVSNAYYTNISSNTYPTNYDLNQTAVRPFIQRLPETEWASLADFLQRLPKIPAHLDFRQVATM